MHVRVMLKQKVKKIKYVGCPNAQVSFSSQDILVSPRFHPVKILTSHHRTAPRLPQNMDSKLCSSQL